MLALVSHLTFKGRHGDSRLTGEEGRRGVFLKALWVAGLICHSLFPLCALALSRPSERHATTLCLARRATRGFTMACYQEEIIEFSTVYHHQLILLTPGCLIIN